MASSTFSIPIAVFASLVIALHLPPTVTSNFFSSSPLLSPIFDGVCKEVACGKGDCKPTKNSTFPFECVCESGWKQPPSFNGFNFLPCVLPNCPLGRRKIKDVLWLKAQQHNSSWIEFGTINVSCSKVAPPAPAPAPDSPTKGLSIDPCSWDICGGGTCKKSSSNSSYSCSCNDGYYNLMNSTSLPCFHECALGGDCQKLGLSIFNHSTAHAPALSANNTANLATSLQHEKLSWIGVLVTFALISTIVA